MNSWEPYLILGIGNCLLSDDGVGVHAARLLQAEPPPETVVLAAETDFLSTLPFLERCTKGLVIDAMDAGQPPGTLYHCRNEDLAAAGRRHSLHELGLLEALEFLDQSHRPEVHILGVQPARIELALDLSPAVAAALPEVVCAARQIIAEFGSPNLQAYGVVSPEWLYSPTRALPVRASAADIAFSALWIPAGRRRADAWEGCGERTLVMSDSLIAELRLGRDGPASAWRYYLPAGSRVLERFHDPVSIVVTGAVRIPGQPPEDRSSRMKVYVSQSPGWVDTGAVVDAFTQLWPEALRAVVGPGTGAVSLVYFSASATHKDLYDLWPYMPFESEDDTRFFVSEVCKDSRTRIPACGWLCVEYDYESFKRMVGPDGFGFRYGTTIMGVSVSEAKAAQYLRLDVLNKDALEKALGDDHLRCWWFCDTDFEGMTLWHKDLSGGQLEECLFAALRVPAERLGLVLRGAQQQEGTGERPN
jgi:hydrogenase maturation protease